MRLRSLPLVAVVAASALAVRPLDAQGLRRRIDDLFIFGPGTEALFLSGSADPNNPRTIQVHGAHFTPAAVADNMSIIGFIGDAIGGSVANLPVGSTSGATSFRFVGGVPMQTTTSAGPIFAERAATVGRGRTLVGLNQSGYHLNALRGTDLRSLKFTFTHENVTGPECDAVEGTSCAPLGVPVHENDVIDVRLGLDIDVRVSSFYLTYGVTDRLDVGVMVPVVSTSMRGESSAQLQPFGGENAQHFFAGTATAPVLIASRTSSGATTGVGDVSLRAKARLVQSTGTSVAVLVDARFPTGSAEDLLGGGAFAGRALAVFSSRFGGVSPHANVGYLYRAGERQNSAVLGTLGFDGLLGPQFTLAADLIGELEVGRSRLELPAPVAFTAPFARVVRPTEIPEMRDDLINGSFGAKYVPNRRVTLLANFLVPLNRGGLRPGVTYTAGMELGF